MHNPTVPDNSILASWLEAGGVDFYHCGHCEGLHLTPLQREAGVLDATVELNQDILYISATAEVRPAMLLSLQAELGTLNNHWPQLKIFVDINDDTLPTLIISQNLLLGEGVTASQVLHFVQHHQEQLGEVIRWCREHHYFPSAETEVSRPPLENSTALH